VESDDYVPYDLEIIADHHFQPAIPLLRKRFAEASDDLIKAKLAVTLLRLGDSAHTDEYFNDLQKYAETAVDSDEPWPDALGTDGADTNITSPAFLGWVQKNHTTTEIAKENAFVNYPLRVGVLAECPDKRAAPLLIRALGSPNYILRAQASEGLLRLEGRGAAPAILAAAAATPALQRQPILRPLLQFGDASIRSQAQSLEPSGPSAKPQR
jgi:hypothetical protein